jgi:hypothetical protein
MFDEIPEYVVMRRSSDCVVEPHAVVYRCVDRVANRFHRDGCFQTIRYFNQVIVRTVDRGESDNFTLKYLASLYNVSKLAPSSD